LKKNEINNLQLPNPETDRTGWPWTESEEQLHSLKLEGLSWPKISVVTPSYNQGQFIEETIRSVLLQGYPNLEFIIIDGGSNDGSVDIIKKYDPWLAYWVSEQDRGQSHAVNKGIRHATGEILLWLNSDDICLPGAFNLVTQAFQSDTDRKLVIGQARIIDQDSKIIGDLCSNFTSWEEIVTNPGNSVRQISTFFSKNLFDQFGLINESLHIAMDTELLVRFIQHHDPIILNEFVTAYRSHFLAKTSSQLLRGYEETDRVRSKYLTSPELITSYRKRSAMNWLNLSESDKYSRSDRIKCLWHAFRIQPTLLLVRGFWSSLKKLSSDTK